MAVFTISFFSKTLTRHTQMVAIIPVDAMDFPAMPGMPPPPDRSKPFRSLYLLHGYSGSEVDWLYGSRIQQLSMMHNIAVFCPAGENSFYLDDKIRGAHYSKLLCEELIELTRKVFPISHRREDTIIGGLSMGGYGAIRNGLYRSDVFGSVIALSSALITDNVSKGVENNPMIPADYFRHTFGPPEKIKGSDVDPEYLAKRIVEENLPRPNIFMACGTEDFLIRENRAFHKVLEDVGIEHTYLEGPGTHEWAFWDTYIEKALQWYDNLSK